MDLKKIDLDKLQDYAFTVNEIETYLGDNNYKFINFKCLDNESLIPTVKAIPLDRIKQARKEMESRLYKGIPETTGFTWQNLGINMCLEILDSLIESEGK